MAKKESGEVDLRPKRRCFYCPRCEKEGKAYRKFLTPLDVAQGKHTPRCEIHGPMSVQVNMPYRGQRTDR